MVAPAFKAPGLIPQDLLLIQDLVGRIEQSQRIPLPAARAAEDDIASSDDGANSEDEVEAEVLAAENEEEMAAPPSKDTEPSDSSSESSSDSESDIDGASQTKAPASREQKARQVDEDDEDDGAPLDMALRTKNEVAEANILVPQISEVGPEERLEKVGEIMSIFDKVVIVKGDASQVQNRASEKALDSETLLVFEDRQVLGYVYETFGPTYQPLYQVKFTNEYPINPEKVKVAREVFHVPQRSNFVFLSELKRQRGSDASNVHDEEPAEYELEFSDDEEEAAYKARLRQRRQGSREPSVAASSRHDTPTPLQAHDQDIVADTFYGGNPYDAHGPYDELGAGPSRPAPKPYDDPYADEYTMDTCMPEQAHAASKSEPRYDAGGDSYTSRPGESGRGRGRGRGKRPDRGGTRGGRGHGDRERRRGRGRGRGRGGDHAWSDGRGSQTPVPDLNAHVPRPLSPTSLAIARATGQYPGFSHPASPVATESPLNPHWSYGAYQPQAQQPYMFGAPQPQSYVQPHINPRFASQLGFNMGFMQHQQYPQYGANMGDYGGHEVTDGWPGQWSSSSRNGQNGEQS